MRSLTSIAAFVASLAVAGCTTTSSDCCAPVGEFRGIADAVAPALEAICTIGFGMRETSSLQADAAEHGFSFWGDFFEAQAEGGTVDVRPGGHAGEPCGLEFMVNHDRGDAIDRALSDWARGQGMTLTAPDGVLDGVARRDRRGPDGSTLIWTYTPSAVADEPAVVVATLDLAVDD